MPNTKNKTGRDYKDRFVRYTQARERNRKAACKQAGEKLKAAISTNEIPAKSEGGHQASAG